MPNDLGTLIAADVVRAETDLQALRTRALSVVGISGGLVTLVSGFLAIAAGGDKDFLPDAARWTVVSALFAYVMATVSALVINLPTDVTAANAEDLQALAQEHWDDEGWDQQVAVLLSKYLVSLRTANASAARWLTVAIGFEIGGIAATAVMAVLVVDHLPA